MLTDSISSRGHITNVQSKVLAFTFPEDHSLSQTINRLRFRSSEMWHRVNWYQSTQRTSAVPLCESDVSQQIWFFIPRTGAVRGKVRLVTCWGRDPYNMACVCGLMSLCVAAATCHRLSSQVHHTHLRTLTGKTNRERKWGYILVAWMKV